jgi:hypothetical protein
MKRQFINLKPGEPGRSIYRIVSCERFLQMLHDRENALVKPRLWDDPFENFILNGIAVMPDGRRAKLGFRDQLYGQCWSLHRETDLMWRGYSPEQDAVKLRTTVRALYDSLRAGVGKYRDVSCFIGRVRYFTKKRIADVLSRVNVVDPSGVAIAATLLVKRWAFRSEREVRLIYLNHRRSFSKKVFRYDIDPNALFEEAVLDPRMRDTEAERWERRFRAAGFSRRIIQSGLYRPPDRVVIKLP